MSVDYNNTPPPLFFKPCQGDMTVAPGDNPAEHIKTYFLGILCHGIAPRATDMPLLRSLNPSLGGLLPTQGCTPCYQYAGPLERGTHYWLPSFPRVAAMERVSLSTAPSTA